MLTQATLAELQNLIATTAAPDRRADLQAALDDLQRTIAAQALTIRNLCADLRNRRIGQESVDAILPADALDAMLAKIGTPRATPFSLDQAQAACAQLADQSARATDIADIAAAVVRVALAFI